MKTLLLVAMMLLARFSVAQDSTGFEKLLAQFTAAYAAGEQRYPSNNYFRNLEYASSVFHFLNPVFMQAMTEAAAGPEEQTFHALTDSVLGRFAKEFLWKGLESQFSRYRSVLGLYGDKACPCYNERLQQKKELRAAMSECEQQISKDTPFMQRFATYLSEFPPQERLGVQQYAPRYLYQSCEAVRTSLNGMLKMTAYENYQNTIYELSRAADEKAMGYFMAGKTDSLLVLFPGYAEWKGDLTKSLPLYKGKTRYSLTSKREEGKLRCTKYFLDKGKVMAKVVYTTVTRLDGIGLVSFAYIPANKIGTKEKAEIEKTGKEVLPPVEEIGI